MLQPSTYPADHPPLKKLEHLRKQAIYLGKKRNFYRVPLTTSFQRGRNRAGVTIQPNGGSGNECTGQNDGSKHSVATTYLTDAWYWGTEIFCGCEVRYVEQAHDGRGYLVYFAWHGSGRSVFEKDFKTQLFWVKAVGHIAIWGFVVSMANHFYLEYRMIYAFLALDRWGQQRFCFAQRSMACQLLQWLVGTCPAMEIRWSLVS